MKSRPLSIFSEIRDILTAQQAHHRVFPHREVIWVIVMPPAWRRGSIRLDRASSETNIGGGATEKDPRHTYQVPHLSGVRRPTPTYTLRV